MRIPWWTSCRKRQKGKSVKRPRKPKWHERNRIAAAGIKRQEQWLVIGRDRECMTIWNRKTGAVREIALGGKQNPEAGPPPDPSEGMARELRERRQRSGKGTRKNARKAAGLTQQQTGGENKYGTI